jgi:ribose transport system substrate-binding protein
MAYFGTKLLDELHHHPPPSLTGDFARQSFSPLPTFVDTGTFIVDKNNVAAHIQENQAQGVSQ